MAQNASYTQTSNKTSPSNKMGMNDSVTPSSQNVLIYDNGQNFIYFEDFDTNQDGIIDENDSYNLAIGGFGQASNYAIQIAAGLKNIPPKSNQQGHSPAAPDTGISVKEAMGGVTANMVENALGIEKPNFNKKPDTGLPPVESNGGLGLGGLNYTEYTESVLDRISELLIKNFSKIKSNPMDTLQKFQKSIRDGELVIGRSQSEKLVLYKQDITANVEDKRLVEKIVESLGGINPESIDMKIRDGIGIFLVIPRTSPPGKPVQFTEIDISGLRVKSNLEGIFIKDNVSQFIGITPQRLEFDVDKTKEHLSTGFSELLPTAQSLAQRIAVWFKEWEDLKENIDAGEVAKLGPNTLKFLDENPETLSYLIKSATDLVYRDVMPTYTRQQWDALTQDHDLATAQVDILNAQNETQKITYEGQITSLTDQINTLVEEVIPMLSKEYGIQEKISTAFLNTLLQAIKQDTTPIDMVNDIPFAETWDDFTSIEDDDFWFNNSVVVSTVEGPNELGDTQAIRCERSISRPRDGWPGALVAGKKALDVKGDGSYDEALEEDLGKIFLKAGRQYRLTCTARANTDDGYARIFIGDTRGGWRGNGYAWGKTQTWQCKDEWVTWSTIFTPTTNPRHTWGNIENVEDTSAPEFGKSYEELGYENHDPDGDGEVNWRNVGGPWEGCLAQIYIYAGTDEGAGPGQWVDYGDIIIEEIGADEEIPPGVEMGTMDMLSDPDYYEDYDINNDGNINVLDAQLWVQGGRNDVADEIVQIVLGNKIVPKRNPFYFEEFDIHTGDGIYTPEDAQRWANEPYNRPEIADQIISVINKERTEHPRRNPIYFEDFDLNGDGKIDVLDITMWNEIGRTDTSQKIVDFVTSGQFPIHRNPFFFEDYDISKEGHLTVIDAQLWINAGRQDVAEELSEIIVGNLPMPIKKEPRFFEDYDINGDGIIDVLDITAFTNLPNVPLAIKETMSTKATEIILGQRPIPLHRDPLFFEDYDVNGDGILDVRDSVIWVNNDRPTIADRIAKFITGEIPMPPSRYGV